MHSWFAFRGRTSLSWNGLWAAVPGGLSCLAGNCRVQACLLQTTLPKAGTGAMCLKRAFGGQGQMLFFLEGLRAIKTKALI